MSNSHKFLIFSMMAGALSQCNNGSWDGDIGYDVESVLENAMSAPNNWEWGTLAQTLLELRDPDIAVFSESAFPDDSIPNRQTESTDYARGKISTDGNTLTPVGGVSADPASLGVSAILLGQSDSEIYTEAAAREANEQLNVVPRYDNGAMSHWYDSVSLWSDFIYMVPPFLAYQGVATNDEGLLREAVNQIGLYRDVLRDPESGVWAHIAGDGSDGTWSTGNGWALGGMARVHATVSHWGPSSGWDQEKQDLAGIAQGIIDATIEIGADPDSGLIRNYVTDSFPEAAGTAAIAAAIYRFAVLEPETFATSKYINWADELRAAVVSAVNGDGVLDPVVNPYDYASDSAYGETSPEAQCFAVLLYTAFRDCVCAGHCSG